MTKYPSEKVEEVRDHADIERVVGRSVQLTRKGQKLWGLCPFHNEKTPSFSVSPDKKLFYCFGCHAGGDVFDFVMRLEGVEFPDAVRVLAEEAGVKLPEDPDESGGKSHDDALLYRVNEVASAYFERQLAGNTAAREYLLVERGLTEVSLKNFRLGWAPAEWSGLVQLFQKKGVPSELAMRLGLIGQGKEGRLYDRLRGRITFPILVRPGGIAGFGARRADWVDPSGPKYLNSIESPIYDKSGILYGLAAAKDAIRRRRFAILVEGYLDVIALWQAGFDNTVASCGTALSARHATLLGRLTKQVVTLYDGDSAGHEATHSSSRLLLEQGLDVHVASLPDGDDPDTFARRSGATAIQKLVDQAPSAVDFFLSKARTQNAGGGVAATLQALDAVRPMILAIQDPLARDVAISSAARELDVREAVLRKHLSAQPSSAIRPTARSAPHYGHPSSATQSGAASSATQSGAASSATQSGAASSATQSATPSTPKHSGTRSAAQPRSERPPPVVELALLRALIESGEKAAQEIEGREAASAFSHPGIQAAVHAGLDALRSGKKFDAPMALEVAKGEGGASEVTLAAIHRALMDTAPEIHLVSECVTRLLRQQHDMLLRRLRERAAAETDPELQVQLAMEVKELLASRTSWEEKN